MSVDLTEVLERTDAPPMDVDAYAVVHGGRRRVRRRRLTAVASATAVVAALGGALVVADSPWVAHLTSAAPSPSPKGPDALLARSFTLVFAERGADGVERSYRATVAPNRALDRNEGRLEVLGADREPTLIGAVPLSHPDRGPVAGEDVPPRGMTWGFDRTGSGQGGMSVVLDDGTEFSVPYRRIPGTSFAIGVLDGLSPSEVGQAMSVTTDNGVPAPR